ncbi:TolB family protein [Streptomyces mauvecolor]
MLNSTTRRLAALFAVSLLLLGVAVAATLHGRNRAAAQARAQTGGPQIVAGSVALDSPGRMLFRSMAKGPHLDELVSVPANDPAGTRIASGVNCLRFHAASGTGVCLQVVHHTLNDTYRAVVLDDHLREKRRYDLAGVPTRARVSADGRMVAWTVFVGGDSYATTSFSTRTSILDNRTGDFDQNLEDYRLILDGHPYKAADVNIWGVTFADDDHFYATMATGGKTYLVHGDRQKKTLTTMKQNVECPSLSPDGTHIAFKKRVDFGDPDVPWRLYVLDLRTMRETATGEQRSIDDQALWHGNNQLVYDLPGDFGSDLWTVPADGTGKPRLVIPSALSPVYTP